MKIILLWKFVTSFCVILCDRNGTGVFGYEMHQTFWCWTNFRNFLFFQSPLKILAQYGKHRNSGYETTGTVTVQDILRPVTGNVRSLFQSFSRRPEICEQTWKALNWVSEEMEIELNVLKYSSSTWNSSKGLWPESDFTMAAWYHDSLVVTGNTM